MYDKHCSRRFQNKIYELQSLGLKPVYEKWLEHEDEWFCYWMEIYIIDYLGLENLCNVMPGGAWPWSGEEHPMYGKHHAEDSLQKMSETKIGMNAGTDHWTFGIPRPPETRAKISEAVPKGEDHYLFGVKAKRTPHSDTSTRQRRSK